MEKPRVQAARAPAVGKTPGEAAEVTEPQQSKCPTGAAVPLASKRLQWHAWKIPARVTGRPRREPPWFPASPAGRQAGMLQAQGHRGGAGACAELPLRLLPRDGGHRAERMSKGAAGADGEPWIPPGDVPRQQRGGDRSHQREPVSLVCGTSPQHTAQAVKQAIKWSDIFAVSVTLEIEVEFSVKVNSKNWPQSPHELGTPSGISNGPAVLGRLPGCFE